MPVWEAPPSFEDYVRTRHQGLLRFAHLLTGDPHLADDLVQDALERAGMAWRRIRQQGDPEGYLRRVITNQYLNRLRTLRRELLVRETPERGTTDPEGRDATLWRALGSLPRKQRAVVVLRFYEDLSDTQIAEILGCSVGTVKSNGSRGLSKLRAALDADVRSGSSAR